MASVATVEQIKEALEALRPALQLDGGDLVLVKFKDNIVYIRLQGACVGCPVAVYTVKFGIEVALKEQFPSIQEVIAVEDE